MFLSEKTTKYKGKARTKSAKTAISGIFAVFSAGKNFYQKSDLAMLWALLICIFVQKIGKKLMMKSRKNAKNRFFRHISGIFGRKKFLSKIGLDHVMSIANMHLWAKNWKTLMMKSRENAKHLVFPAYSTGNICFSKIGLRHILDIVILHQCAKFHEKI